MSAATSGLTIKLLGIKEELTVDTAQTAVQTAGTAPGVVSVSGRDETASGVACTLLDVLADEPGVVDCDLEGMAAEGSAMGEDLLPVARYLARWPGPVVMMYAPDPRVRASLRATRLVDRLFVSSSRDAARSAPHRLLPDIQRQRLRLAPGPTAAKQARAFVDRALLDWRLPRVVAPASAVVEKLARSVTTDSTVGLDLMVSRVDDLIRLAVRERSPHVPAASLGEVAQSPLQGSGLHLVQGLARGWGVIPSPTGGRTLWAVLDAPTTAHPHPAPTPPQQRTRQRVTAAAGAVFARRALKTSRASLAMRLRHGWQRPTHAWLAPLPSAARQPR